MKKEEKLFYYHEWTDEQICELMVQLYKSDWFLDAGGKWGNGKINNPHITTEKLLEKFKPKVPEGILEFTNGINRSWKFSERPHQEQEYVEWVQFHLKEENIVQKISLDGIEWTTGENIKMGYDTFIINSFKWDQKAKTWSAILTDKEDKLRMGKIWVGNFDKLPEEIDGITPNTQEYVDQEVAKAEVRIFQMMDNRVKERDKVIAEKDELLNQYMKTMNDQGEQLYVLRQKSSNQ